jgi:hypothetical protein
MCCVDIVRFSDLLDALAGQVNLYLFDMDGSVACKCRDFHEGYADVEHGPIGRKILLRAPCKVLSVFL